MPQMAPIMWVCVFFVSVGVAIVYSLDNYFHSKESVKVMGKEESFIIKEISFMW